MPASLSRGEMPTGVATVMQEMQMVIGCPCLQQSLLTPRPAQRGWNKMSEDAQDLYLRKQVQNKNLLTCKLIPSTSLVTLLITSSRYCICQCNITLTLLQAQQRHSESPNALVSELDPKS